MMTLHRRLWILFVIVTIGFFSALLIPKSGKTTLSLLKQDLPDVLLTKQGYTQEVTQEELDGLAADTIFSRKGYRDVIPENGKFDPEIRLSVVFSGKDINNSIHRPQVCLIAQGWEIISTNLVTLDVEVPNYDKVGFTELICRRSRVEVLKDELGNKTGEREILDMMVQYYTFVGSEVIVPGHIERTWEDIRARILKGNDQQWAYTTYSSSVLSVYEEQGFNLGNFKALNLTETQEMLKTFIKGSLPQIL